MPLTITALVAEIVGLVGAVSRTVYTKGIDGVIEWLATRFLGTNAFWPLMILAAIYLCIRGLSLARKKRRAS